jgi:small basic protein (TIGR04137 family)
MSLHRSLKTKPTALNQHRNVLTRAERIERLREKGKFDPDQSPIGLVKVANRMVATKKKKTEKAEGAEGEAATGATAAAPAGAAAPAKKAASKK